MKDLCPLEMKADGSNLSVKVVIFVYNGKQREFGASGKSVILPPLLAIYRYPVLETCQFQYK